MKTVIRTIGIGIMLWGFAIFAGCVILTSKGQFGACWPPAMLAAVGMIAMGYGLARLRRWAHEAKSLAVIGVALSLVLAFLTIGPLFFDRATTTEVRFWLAIGWLFHVGQLAAIVMLFRWPTLRSACGFESHDRCGAISRAVFWGRENTIRELIDAGNELNDPHWGAPTPLMVAVIKRKYGLIPLLIAAGAAPNVRSFAGRFRWWTPLQYAEYKRDKTACELLQRSCPWRSSTPANR